MIGTAVFACGSTRYVWGIPAKGSPTLESFGSLVGVLDELEEDSDGSEDFEEVSDSDSESSGSEVAEEEVEVEEAVSEVEVSDEEDSSEESLSSVFTSAAASP